MIINIIVINFKIRNKIFFFTTKNNNRWTYFNFIDFFIKLFTEFLEKFSTNYDCYFFKF